MPRFTNFGVALDAAAASDLRENRSILRADCGVSAFDRFRIWRTRGRSRSVSPFKTSWGGGGMISHRFAFASAFVRVVQWKETRSFRRRSLVCGFEIPTNECAGWPKSAVPSLALSRSYTSSFNVRSSFAAFLTLNFALIFSFPINRKKCVVGMNTRSCCARPPRASTPPPPKFGFLKR